MSYLIWAHKKGRVGQINYTFEVKGKTKGRRFVFDVLGWYKLNYFTRPQESNIYISQRYMFLDLKKISFWSYKDIYFMPKARRLMFYYCLFLIIQRNSVLNKKN